MRNSQLAIFNLQIPTRILQLRNLHFFNSQLATCKINSQFATPNLHFSSRNSQFVTRNSYFSTRNSQNQLALSNSQLSTRTHNSQLIQTQHHLMWTTMSFYGYPLGISSSFIAMSPGETYFPLRFESLPSKFCYDQCKPGGGGAGVALTYTHVLSFSGKPLQIQPFTQIA